MIFQRRQKLVESDEPLNGSGEGAGEILQYAWGVDSQSKNVKKTKRAARLVRKLNCGAKMKNRELEENEMNRYVAPPTIIEPTSWEAKELENADWKGLEDAPYSFSCQSSAGEFLNSQSDWWSTSPDSDSAFTDRNPDMRAREQAFKASPAIDDRGLSNRKMANQKQRWLSGLQQQTSPVKIVGPASLGDDSTSLRTGGSTAGSYSDYTTENSSVESDTVLRRRPNQSSSDVRHERRKKGITRKATSKVKSRNEDNSLWAGVAEDLGILAGLVLADGTACVGTMTEVARETVAESCTSPSAGTASNVSSSTSKRSRSRRHIPGY